MAVINFSLRQELRLPLLHWVRAPEKKFETVVVFVHQFGGHYRQYLNLQKWWGEQGFDSVSFDLSLQNWPPRVRSLAELKALIKGSRHLWAKEVGQVFDQIQGPLLVNSFSMPSVSALEAISERPMSQFCGWITEGGPFVNSLQCFWNFFKVYHPIKNPLFRLGAIGVSQLALGYFDVEKDAEKFLQKLPVDFPILSVRGWQDPIVAPYYIEQFFSHGSHLKHLEVLALPEGQHIDGFRKNRTEYEPRVLEFIRKLKNLK